ncbi:MULTISPECIES: MFS transporter [Thermomonospora]|uniref:Major facilitator superfamily MFS_1 n=1 Tax=Thermomonospora curvata (strain ATCC 19995 / DSM 43183 / JCM 3096 / KCTC 9072 / NBRC 15933 / NCIMB 10081 / Henssen B9) TaxID=471852 RepID=D1A3S7_THECD|nr:MULTISPECIES: nitrate/nitrite transporter [Thermomonospora]ACY97980.1 major facilitator superfamily MFS_1 [Thermomonospora curvata DSM 43183]PKK14258.1 MAG: NarK/NasA family nitrate transporter [Thermomonospora sp. CIF 1]
MTVLTDPQQGRTTSAARSAVKGGRWIDDWEPDDADFWARTGRRVAARNLVFSILTEHLGFCVWLLWSIAVLNLQSVGMQLSVGQILWLTTLPNLVGAAMRIPYTFAPARFGGRNWTIVSALLLLIPCGLFVYAVENPDIPYWALLLIAATTGLGGGNFASSMANITHYYPTDKQGLPLGLNAAGGNIGVSVTQLAMPPLIVAFGLAAVGWVWMPFILLAAAGAYFFMNNLRGAASAYTAKEMIAGCKDRQTIIMSVLYIGTFGSFIGYSFTFGVLITSQFPGIKASDFIWLGAFAGSLARPLGGWLADRFGGARVTMLDFLLMGLGIVAVAVAVQAGSWPLFLAAFLFVFVATGIGNGSTYKMIPAIFRTRAMQGVDAGDAAAVKSALAAARRAAAASIGISSAVGALGGVLIQQAFRISLESVGGIGPALAGLAVFYGLCVALTWATYLRKVHIGGVRMSLAQAGV